jgi:DNA-binding NarL/FixJ family response regulator
MVNIFISYSHTDWRWKDRVITHLSISQRYGRLELWCDSCIEPGEDWYEKVQTSLDSADVAVLLISADFLTSKFILTEEVPRLLQRRESEGLHVVPVIVRPCAWQEVTWLKRMQLEPKNGKPLSTCRPHQVEQILAKLAVKIAHPQDGVRDKGASGTPPVPQRDDQGESERVKRILIVDDHPIVRQGSAQIINQEKDLEVCGGAADAHEAMQAIRQLNPDLVVVDISLRDTSGIELIKDLKVQYPNLPVLVLSMHWEAIYGKRALRAGAKGYLLKQEATEKLVTAIRCALAGGVYVSSDMAAEMVKKSVDDGSIASNSPADRLSEREMEVFRMIGQGFSTREMAEKLHVSIKTIETYRAHIKDKLDLPDASELLRAAVRWVNQELAGG